MSPKRKPPARLAAPFVRSKTNGLQKSTIDESRASVAGSNAVQLLGQLTTDDSGDESVGSFSDEDVDEKRHIDGLKAKYQKQLHHQRTNGLAVGQLPSPNQSSLPDELAEDALSDVETTSPSFGELLRGNEAIDVSFLLQEAAVSNNPSTPTPRASVVPSSHQSLTTVLSQALRTDDADLLESCIQTTNLQTIRHTLEQLDSSLAGILLNKLASRLYRRPGRAGSLMTWVQWALIVHGGTLASQPKVLHGLSGLQRVLTERAKGLSSLLALKGRLDLLEGQMEMRRRMQTTSTFSQQVIDEDDRNSLWVEGVVDTLEDQTTTNRTQFRRNRIMQNDSYEDMVPLTNGHNGVSDEGEEAENSADEDDESDDIGGVESPDEDEVDYDDLDESVGEMEESDADAASPLKVQKIAKSFSKRR